jgi:hypothetical protein
MLLRKQVIKLLTTFVGVKTKSLKFSRMFLSSFLNPYSYLIYDGKNFLIEMIY